MTSGSPGQMPVVLIVGVGSHHGDDQAGWRVIEHLACHQAPWRRVRSVNSPAALLDHLAGVDVLMICDACVGGPTGGWYRWPWPSAELKRLRSACSHDVGLPMALALADELRLLPRSVTIWGIVGESFVPGAAMSPEVDNAAKQVAASILKAVDQLEADGLGCHRS